MIIYILLILFIILFTGKFIIKIIIINYFIFCLQSVYSTIPGIFANMAPVFVKKLNFLDYPLDFGIKINDKPLLGPKKTVRGFLFGIIFSMFLFAMEFVIFKYTSLKNLGLINFNEVNFIFMGFLMGFGVMFGDLFKSFIKRRLDIPSSKSFIPWDQLDCVIGGLIFGRIVWDYSLKYAMTIIVLTFIIHVSLRHAGYYLKFNETKW